MKWTHVTFVESDETPGKSYEIKRHPTTGKLGCGCPAFRFGGTRSCKHLEALGRLDGFGIMEFAGKRVSAETVARVTVQEETFTFRTGRAMAFGASL